MTMSGFELNTNWDVDKTAESLNNSLFGHGNTKKKLQKSNLAKTKNQEIDNDDEKLSKKEKKKLKGKRRKMNKLKESSDAVKTDGIANKKNNIIFKSKTVKNTKSALIENTGETKLKSKNKHKKKKAQKMPNKVENISENSFNAVSQTEVKRKRKRSQSKDSGSAQRPRTQNQEIDYFDVKLSKKEKNKLKEKKRKMDKLIERLDAKKTDGICNKQNNTIFVYETVENTNSALIESPSETKLKSKNKRKKKKAHKMPNKIGNISETSISGVTTTEVNRKRKISQSEDSDITHKPKKVKLDKVKATENKTENSNGVPAEKRKARKKKNTSRKNREKQLAMKNKPKPSLAVIIRENNDLGAEAGSSKTVDSHVQKNVDQLTQLQTNNDQNKKKSKKLSQDFKTVETLQTYVPQSSLSKSKLQTGKKQSKKKSLNNSSESVNTVIKGGLHETQDLKKNKKEKKLNCEVTLNSKPLTDSDFKQKDKKPKKKLKKVNGINNISDVETTLESEYHHKNGISQKRETNSAKEIHTGNSDKRSERKSPDAEAPTSGQSLWESSALGNKARDKLKSARFRFINEQLYTCTGAEALKMFGKDREAFQVYHEGYENQVSKWPVNPVDIIIRQLKNKPESLVVADFGCGDAKLAASLPHKVHSFDLVAVNDRVTVCDMSKTPLPNESVDVAVFCLSLMGTNIGDYILEANRILKDGGLLKIIEVVSRFKGVSEFIGGIYKRGFQLLTKRDVNEMFYQMDFKKVKTIKKSSSLAIMKLNPCLYKKR